MLARCLQWFLGMTNTDDYRVINEDGRYLAFASFRDGVRSSWVDNREDGAWYTKGEADVVARRLCDAGIPCKGSK